MIVDRRKQGPNPPGFQVWRDKKLPYAWRTRHRASGQTVNCRKFEPYTMEWYAECARVAALVEKTASEKPGTLGMAIKLFRESNAFTDLADRTRHDYQRVFDFLQPIGDTALVKFDTPLVVRIRDRIAAKHGWRWGNYTRTVMSLLFEWCRERGHMTTNPAFRLKAIKRPKSLARANRPWSDEERHAVWQALPAHMRVPVALMMYCALDPQDALSLPRTAVRDGKIDTRRGKTGTGGLISLPAPVAEAIEAAPQHDAITLCANSRGKPWTVSGFRASWAPVRIALEEAGAIGKGLTLKGLRHTVATVLAELGFDERTIADMLQQKTTAMARHYSRDADKSRKLEGVMVDFTAEMNRRGTKIVKPE
ncbi:tyrosine-type recombinase/integrase [Oricola sp.]|uniref:tyrosine-type recombinase/integrase n=1 Tax=Oricola sp. TaxID=1979950 RepID=UPI0025F26319|nr:tyrosine-type recombinase/integrase [Oricola sp.]MCI5078239.1 tyrosine-type recombinase/integrase [Oricola sp.]